MRSSRSIALACLVALAATAAVSTALPAAAHSSGAAGPDATGPTETVSLQLAPRDAAGLARLATTRGLTQAQRITRLDAVLPGTARAQQVAALARGLGLTVTGFDELSVDVTAPAGTVRALFGSARAQQASLPTAQALPEVPSALGGLVAVAVGGDENRPAVKSHAVRPSAERSSSTAAAPTDGSLSVAQARGINRVSATTTVQSASAPIVASLQFPSPAVQGQTGISNLLADLSTYAGTNKLYGSAAWSPGNGTTGQVVAVTPTAQSDSVVYPDSSHGVTCTDDTDYSDMPGGDETADEVALDQETLLTTAPQLRQRIYYAPNCGDAQYDAMKQVLFDVTTNHLPISALSTSWGQCEPQLASALLTEDKSVVQMLQAAGVTVFAATGDTGAFDCSDANGDVVAADAVDDPGSVPGVVAVGGTAGTTAAALGTWNGAGFSSGGGFSCVASDGSTAFAQPSYQSTVTQASRYPHNGFHCPTGSAVREVPDVAADAADGLDVLVTEIGHPQTTYQIIGTSFSAPLAAGGYAQTLANAGKTGTDVQNASSTGLPGLLYSAGTAALVDVTRGTNGDYAATPGWDPTTGLGTPHWPTVLASVTQITPSSGTSTATTLTAPAILTSPNGTVTAALGTDGNFVVRDQYTNLGTVSFVTNTTGHSGAAIELVVQSDGNIVERANGAAIWSSATVGSGITALTALNNGTLAGVSAGGVVIWTPAGRTGATPSSLPASSLLTPGQSLISPDGDATGLMQTDGTFIVRQNGTEEFYDNGNAAGSYLSLGPDGNLTVQSAGVTVFTAGATGNPHDTLRLANGGILQLVSASGLVVWQGTAGPTSTLTGLTSSVFPYNHTLLSGQAVWASNASFVLNMQTDGNLVERNSANGALFQSQSGGHAGGYAVFQGDGNLVVRAANGAATYATGTAGLGGTVLIMQTDGNIVMRKANGTAVWTSRNGRV